MAIKQTLFFIFFYLICFEVGADSVNVFNRDGKITNKLLYGAKKQILTIPLNDATYNLPYMMGDMGPDSDILPKPLKINPGKAVYLISPGENFSNRPFFMKLSFDGNIQFNVNLREVLGIEDSAIFAAENLFIYPNDATCVLYGNSYDPSTNLYFDYQAAFFDLKGKLLKKLVLPKLDDLNSIYVLENGCCWAYLKKSRTWSFFSPDGKKLHSTMATFLGTILSDGTLLCLSHKDTMILCDTSGKKTLVNIVPNSLLDGFFVRGSKAFIGLATIEWNTVAKDTVKMDTKIQVMYYNSKKSTVSFFPPAELVPYIGAVKDIPLEACDVSSLTFDSMGNFYSSAHRGGKQPAITIYKMEINEELVKKITQDK